MFVILTLMCFFTSLYSVMNIMNGDSDKVAEICIMAATTNDRSPGQQNVRINLHSGTN